MGASLGAGVAALAGRNAGAEEAEQPATVEVRQDRTVLDCRIEGKPFFAYNFDSSHAGLYRPFFHPVMGPNQRPITQNGEFPGSLRGHYWHRALFIAHQKVGGMSFWEERALDCGKIVHLEFVEFTSGNTGGFVERLAWRDLAGRDLLREERTARAGVEGRSRFLDLGLKLSAPARDVELAATPYNLLACRVLNAMCLLPEKEGYTRRFGSLVDFAPLAEGGSIRNSEGKENEACRGQRARWCDFSGPLGDGSRGGVAILDHPRNPRHPTPWHNWNNMTITASFTFHEPFTLKQGDELALSYRVLVHPGDAREADIEGAWRAWRN